MKKSAPVVIMITGFDSSALQKEADTTLLDGLLSKPVTSSDLFNAIADILGSSARDEDKKAEKKETSTNLQGLKVLLAEDNNINQQIARELLEDKGIVVTIVEDGQKAVDAINKGPHSFDLILMDIQMPIMDGYEATAKIRETHNSKTLPILAMTAHALAGEKEKSLKAGLNDHITKPINPDSLFETLSQYVKPREANPTSAVKKNQASKTKLSELKHINTKKGITNVGGNESLYIKLLKEIHTDNDDMAKIIGDNIAAGELTYARELTHSIRGAFGSLGAEEFFAIASTLEAMLEGDDLSKIDSVYKVFSKELDALMDELALIQ
jgi:two-component system sensor histidine kinase/response regulator